METRANYALIGFFTLAVIAGAFGFVYWFSGAEKQGERKSYKIVFTGSISGLSNNGVVLFNGVPVGAVTKIGLLPEDPSRVYALVEVDDESAGAHRHQGAAGIYRLHRGCLRCLDGRSEQCAAASNQRAGAGCHCRRALAIPGSRCAAQRIANAGLRLILQGPTM